MARRRLSTAALGSQDISGLSLKETRDWPKPFPTYTGRFAYFCDEKNHPDPVPAGQKHLGNGTYIWQLTILGHTVQIDPLNNVITCQMRKELKTVPGDCSPGMKAQMGKYIIENWSGKSFIREKEFMLECDGTSGDFKSDIDFGLEDVPLARPVLAGKYEFQLINEDTCIRSCHSSWVEIAKIAPYKAMGYLLRKDEPNCPKLQRRTVNVQQLVERADEYLINTKIFEGDMEREVQFLVHKVHLTQVSTVEECFDGSISIDFRWLASRSDVFEFVSDQNKFTPEFELPEFVVLNTKNEDDLKVIYSKPELRKVDNFVYVQVKRTYKGRFLESLELNNFPFDYQWLHGRFQFQSPVPMSLICINQMTGPNNESLARMKKAEKNNSKGTQGHNEKFEFELFGGEWMFRRGSVDYSDHHHDHSGGGSSMSGATFHITVGVQLGRNPLGYVARVFGVVSLCVLITFAAFAIPPLDGLADRLSLVCTMMLTVAAYSAVVSGFLPVLGYNTLLDNYVLTNFFFYLVIVFQISLVGLVARSREREREDPDTPLDVPLRLAHMLSFISVQNLDRRFFIFDMLCVILGHVGLIVAVYWKIIPDEKARKMDDDGEDDEGGESDDEDRDGMCWGESNGTEDDSAEGEDEPDEKSRLMQDRNSHSRSRKTSSKKVGLLGS